MSREEIEHEARRIRGILAPAFSRETAYEPAFWRPDRPGTGHCPIASILASEALPSRCEPNLVSVDHPAAGEHWFLRLKTRTDDLDVDLTADQIGDDPVAIATADELYGPARPRTLLEVTPETWRRYVILRDRAEAVSGLVL